MSLIKSEKELIHWVGYPNAPQSAVVEFRSSLKQSTPLKYYKPQPASDVYWKIGLSLADVDTARSERGACTSERGGHFSKIIPGYRIHVPHKRPIWVFIRAAAA